MAHDTEKLRELLERVEEASGPDRELDGDVWVFLDDRPFNRVDGPPCYSASLDASIALVERMLPGWVCTVEIKKTGRAWLRTPRNARDFFATGTTPPLAILSALLRALISQAEGEAKHG